ncbi:MAG: hypothetical protein IT359_03805 [Gemmatimonadaceae bacterium]|nr:hypothetical protein [Gemmatimonadaceae bacterium]
MPGPPVSIGCSVIVSPGAAGPPDSGVLLVVPQGAVTAGGMPLAVVGSICQMVNSVSGVPYPLPIASGGSTGVTINGMGILRVGDVIQAGSGMLMLLGPPAAPYITDSGA